jgi:hypothetical protein
MSYYVEIRPSQYTGACLWKRELVAFCARAVLKGRACVFETKMDDGNLKLGSYAVAEFDDEDSAKNSAACCASALVVSEFGPVAGNHLTKVI